jgi:DNA mismatch repair protein MutS
MIITGPNMAGKSTYMRQVALLVIMAQIGSFIPAKSADICPVERIFTRVGASDDLATGQSTFMVEMNEVAQILHHANADSLVILDEVGRGTSTYDGMSIAGAVLEYLTEKIQAKTLFATHYHELMALADRYPAVKNHSVAVKEKGNDVLFLRRIIAGGTDKSYGIHVAQLAGLPKKVIERAQANLDHFSVQPIGEPSLAPKTEAVQVSTPPACQATLFGSNLSEEILAADIMTMTPLEALNLLYKLQQQAKQEAGQA